MLSEAQVLQVLEGSVLTSDNQPVAGATLHLLNTERYVVSNEQGRFQINSLKPGTYQLECSAAGFATVIHAIIIGDRAVPLILQLQPNYLQLDALLVSAEKREAPVQQSPLAISVISAKKAEQFRIWNSRDLSALAPNLYSTHSGDDRNVTSIRGITTTSYTPTVTTYIDGVSQFNLDSYIATLYDIERIEILRGPQGTLYGRNAMGGIINILTKPPAATSKGQIEINLGNRGIQRYLAALRIPLYKNKLFLGASAQFFRRNGFYINRFNHKDFDQTENLSGNYFLKYVPKPSWSFTLNVKHQHVRNEGAFPLVNGVVEALEKPFELNQNATSLMLDRTVNTSLVARHDGQHLLFTAQWGYQLNYRYYRNPLDADFSPLDAVTIFNNYGSDWNRVRVFTQELRLASPSSGTRAWHWTAGAYLFHQYSPVKQATRFGRDAGLLGVPDTDFSLINTSRERVNGQALFGELTRRVNKNLYLTVGLRGDREQKQLRVNGAYEKAGIGTVVTRPDTAAETAFYSPSPKISLRYQLNEEYQLYALWSRGFRAGGFTPLSTDPTQPPLYAYDPEYCSNWELGSKNSFWNKRLIMNVSIFLAKVRNAQVPTLILPEAITLIRNTGRMVSRGLEVEGSITPAKGLAVDYAYGFTHARYQSFNVATGGEPVDYRGKSPVFTPRQTGLLAAQYHRPLPRAPKVVLATRMEWIITGTTYFNWANTLLQKGYGLLNTRIGIIAGNKECFFWARNLTGKKYIAYAYDFGAVHLGDPMTWGVSFKLSIRTTP